MSSKEVSIQQNAQYTVEHKNRSKTAKAGSRDDPRIEEANWEGGPHRISPIRGALTNATTCPNLKVKNDSQGITLGSPGKSGSPSGTQ